MKKSNRAVVVSLTVGALLVGLAGGYAMAAQPHMQAALASLQTAMSELQSADPDKGGHRVKAMAFVRDAINQTNLGMAAAR